jgi:hypothetical protein
MLSSDLKSFDGRRWFVNQVRRSTNEHAQPTIACEDFRIFHLGQSGLKVFKNAWFGRFAQKEYISA